MVVQRFYGKDDVLMIFTYLVDAKVPFLCRKRILEKKELENRYKKRSWRLVLVEQGKVKR